MLVSRGRNPSAAEILTQLIQAKDLRNRVLITLGLLLLVMRVRMAESSLYQSLERHGSVGRGRWFSLFFNPRLRWRDFGAIAQGMPIWFVVGVLLTFSPELGRELRITGQIDAGRAIMSCYAGAVLGDQVQRVDEVRVDGHAGIFPRRRGACPGRAAPCACAVPSRP